jgi:selenide, water dikinase
MKSTVNILDFASDGGCSKKASALELRLMLKKVYESVGGKNLKTLSSDLPDVGIYSDGSTEFCSTIDIVLPMVHDAADFGKIVVNHALNDIYSFRGSPRFALCVLGVPSQLKASDDTITTMLSAACQQLAEEGVQLVGGHTLADQADLSLGFSAVGTTSKDLASRSRPPRSGDAIVLTKALGTSVASLRWKMGEAEREDHLDVLDGMLSSNRMASVIMSRYKISACTDVTGYGLLGHLKNILLANSVSARVQIRNISIYKSVESVVFPSQTSQYWNNIEYVKNDVFVNCDLREIEKRILYDSQVSSGFIIILDSVDAVMMIEDFKLSGCEATIVGNVEKYSDQLIIVDP